jgi:hypothetical protein
LSAMLTKENMAKGVDRPKINGPTLIYDSFVAY